jgi:acyl-CoA synthetase (NDP forming)
MRSSRSTKLLTYSEANLLLSKYGLPLATGEIATSPFEASRIAAKLGNRVALKIISSQITHKTEAKAVKLNVANAEVEKAFGEIVENARKYDLKAQIDGVLVQEMIPDGVEVIVGVSRDAQFGPVILFGIGGIFAEILNDVSLRLPPITDYDAEEMIAKVKGHKLLQGFRGRPKADTNALIDVLLKVSKLTVDARRELSEMDLNPVIVGYQDSGAKVVDARIFMLQKAL